MAITFDVEQAKRGEGGEGGKEGVCVCRKKEVAVVEMN